MDFSFKAGQHLSLAHWLERFSYMVLVFVHVTSFPVTDVFQAFFKPCSLSPAFGLDQLGDLGKAQLHTNTVTLQEYC